MTLLLCVLVVPPLLVAILPLVAESKFIYFPSRDVVVSPAELGLQAESVSLRASDGVRIDAVWCPAPAEQVTLLYCHGNAGNLTGRLGTAQSLVRRGVSVLLFDYRGYGRSEGEPSEEGLYRDVRAAWEWLSARRSRIVLFGRSLGAAVATQLAVDLEQAPAGLVTVSAFTSVRAMATKNWVTAPAALTLRSRYDNLGKFPRLRCPVLVVHGTADDLVPVSMGRQLFEAAPEPKRWRALEGAGHNDLRRAGDAYLDTIVQFAVEMAGR